MTFQSYERYLFFQNHLACQKAIKKYENSIRNFNEDFEEVNNLFSDHIFKLIYAQAKPEEKEESGTFIDWENDILCLLKGKELVSRYQELDARAPHCS